MQTVRRIPSCALAGAVGVAATPAPTQEPVTPDDPARTHPASGTVAVWLRTIGEAREPPRRSAGHGAFFLSHASMSAISRSCSRITSLASFFVYSSLPYCSTMRAMSIAPW